MNYFVFLFLVSASAVVLADRISEAERAQMQRQLDDACEKARSEKIESMRPMIYEVCMANRNDDAFCRADANAYTGNREERGPRFYDRTECEDAFEYRKKHRIRE